MNFMFQGCINLKNIDLSSFDKIFGIMVFEGVTANIIINKNSYIDKKFFEDCKINITYI